MRLLTTSEAAEYLRLKERKLYELVAEGAIPCTKVTGKWLFPKDELDRWLNDSLTRPDGMSRADPMPIVGGSHDPLLEWALRESGSGLAILAEGSEAGLARYQRGELVAAGIHLHSMLDESTDANLEAIQNLPGLHDAVLLAFVRREVGFLTAVGNPLGIKSLEDVERSHARMAIRPEGAGAQLLLKALIGRTRTAADRIAFVEPPCPTGADVAQAIKVGRADCGIAVRAVADAAALDFVPIMSERFDLVVRQREYFRPPMQALIKFLGNRAFISRAKEMGGYDTSDAGRVRAAP
ncbi:MAG TPA: helix-turn-helix transcriptional regulator [Xanthobacteraceae bacterium]